MIFFKSILAIWEREVIRYRRDKTRVISTFFQPLMFLLIFGMGLQRTLAQGNFGIDFLQFMYPGIIAMNVMSIAFFCTISTVWDREFGFLKEILVAPVSRIAIVIGKVLGATTVASIQALILLVVAPLIGLSIHPLIIGQLFLLMILLAFTISGMGLLIASIMKTTESFGVVMQLLIFPMFFISGAFFPLTAAPGWMVVISRFNPLTYGVDSMRQILLGPELNQALSSQLILYPLSLDILYLAIFSVIMVILAAVAFNKRS